MNGYKSMALIICYSSLLKESDHRLKGSAHSERLCNSFPLEKMFLLGMIVLYCIVFLLTMFPHKIIQITKIIT